MMRRTERFRSLGDERAFIGIDASGINEQRRDAIHQDLRESLDR